MEDDDGCARPALKREKQVIKKRGAGPNEQPNERSIEDRSTSEPDIFRGTNRWRESHSRRA